jgi:hypothetical protein
MVKNYPGVFEYDPLREYFFMKPHAVLSGLAAIARGAA